MRVTVRVLALFVSLLATACDSGPSGPGTLTAVATGNALGGVVLEVRGAGIRGFEARGDARVYAAPVAGEEGVHRVIVITPVPGDLPFSIEVDDVGMEGPAVTVISAARGDNYVVPASSVTVRVER